MSQYELKMQDYGVSDCIVRKKTDQMTISLNEVYRKKYWRNAISVKDYMHVRKSLLENALKDYSFKIINYEDYNTDDYEEFKYQITLQPNSIPKELLVPIYEKVEETLKEVSSKVGESIAAILMEYTA